MQTETKHTPGPWALKTVPTSIGSCHKIGRFPASGTRDETYACVYADGYGCNDKSRIAEELRANARLISAAPDLLEALEEITRSATPNRTEHPAMLQAWMKAQVAISKATGEL